MVVRKKIVLKVTGEVFIDKSDRSFTVKHFTHLAEQICSLQETHQFCIVMGGGNFFRGFNYTNSATIGIAHTTSHQVGMLATIMNGLIVKDLLEQQSVNSTFLCALHCPEVSSIVSPANIAQAIKAGDTIIFGGGTGNPFFTTDTSAIIRALQVGATEIWKATTVDGVYTTDPNKDSNAQLLKHISLQHAIDQKIGIMDRTAYVLALEHNRSIKVFNIFVTNALVQAASQTNFGSVIS